MNIVKEIELKGYTIHKDGYVINKHGKVLYGNETCKGYMRVNINTKNHRVHRLVALKYIPNPYNYDQVNHIDANKKNNCVSNLEWCNNEGNVKHSYEMGLSTPKVQVLDLHTGIIYESIWDVSKSLPNIEYKRIQWGLLSNRHGIFKKRYKALR
jgi:hypothetical protein